MDILRRMYEELCVKETSIRRELSTAQKMPKVEVLIWLDDVKRVKHQLGESSQKITRRFRLKQSKHVFQLSREVDQLLKASVFPNGLTVSYRVIVNQCPKRSELADTILANLRDPNVGITSIYGNAGVGKTTAMMQVSNELATSDVYDSIFWVKMSKHWSLHKVQSYISLQINLDLSMYEDVDQRATVLLESLQKIEKYLIIFDDLWVRIPLKEAGIPQPNRENGCKIVLLTRDFGICRSMEADKFIKVEHLSGDEKWDLFYREAGNVVLNPEIQPLARQVVEGCLGLPFVISSIGNAMRVEVTVEAWRKTLKNLLTIQTKILRSYEDGMDILRSKYEQLCAKETNTRRELRTGEEQEKKPTEEVLRWIKNVERIHSQVNSSRCFSDRYSFPNKSKFIIDLSKEVDELLEIGYFGSALFVEPRSNRSQLMDVIWENLMERRIGIISILGMGGVGKTTTMMKISQQLETSDIFDTIIWITVSKDLNLHKIQREIALQLNLDLPMYEDVKSRADRLLESLKKIKNFLIIFDDLWAGIPLKKVGIPRPSKENGCKIVLTTRELQTCRYMYSDKIIRVEVLSTEEAWDLFVRKAGSVVLNPEIEPFARRVVRTCRGVPIITISVGLAIKDEVSVGVWTKALEELSIPLTKSQDIVLELLRFSYNRLRNDKVKKCFLYCALFPEDYLFMPEELIRYWMAELFIHELGDIILEIDDGYEILRELQEAHMLEIFTKSGVEWFKMHDLFRDLALQIMKEEHGFLVKAGLGLQELPYWEWAEAKRISLMRNQIERLYVVPFNKPNVSTLLLNDNPITHIFPSFFSRILALEILDISYSWITELPPSLSELAKLRVLFLHYCRSLKKIPSLEKMKELQVLTLCGTLITEMPHGMEGLISLRSLDLSETTKLASIQVGLISSLSRLEELRMQGSGLSKMNSPVLSNYLIEIRSLKRLAILTLSVVGYGDHLETIMYLQEQNLKIFSVNVYGSIEDYIEDVERV